MKRTWVLGICTAALAIGACDWGKAGSTSSGSTSSGSPTAGSAASAAKDAKEQRSIEGIVGDVSKDSFEVKTAAGEKVKLKVEGNAMLDGQPFSPGALTEGAQVRASYSKDGMSNVVHQIESVGGAAPSGSAPAPGGDTKERQPQNY